MDGDGLALQGKVFQDAQVSNVRKPQVLHVASLCQRFGSTKAELTALFRGGARVFKQVGASWMGGWWDDDWVVVSNIFYFTPHLGKWSNLTNIFQLGWNHQLDEIFIFVFFFFRSLKNVFKKKKQWFSVNW